MRRWQPRTMASTALVVAAFLVSSLAPLSVAAAGKVDFDRPAARSLFPDGTTWQQDFRAARPPRRVELMTRLEGTETWLVQEVGFFAVGKDGFEATLTDPTFQLPNSRIRYRFRVTPASGPPETGPEATLLVKDDRIDWQTLKGDLVTIHWQAGDVEYAEAGPQDRRGRGRQDVRVPGRHGDRPHRLLRLLGQRRLPDRPWSGHQGVRGRSSHHRDSGRCSPTSPSATSGHPGCRSSSRTSWCTWSSTRPPRTRTTSRRTG